MDNQENKSIIENRLRIIEERLDGIGARKSDSTRRIHPAWPFPFGLAALVFGYLGLGLPQHYYQPLFAGLLLVLLYHRGLMLMHEGAWRWPQVILNFALLCLLFKLLIGGGMSYPFEWLKVPSIAKAPGTEGGPWYDKLIPDLTVQWQGIPKLSDWSVDLTKIQTLLLIATLAGALLRFQPFTSLTALALLIISIPAYLAFNWDWVVLFLISGSVSVYLQSGRKNVNFKV